MHRKRGLRFEKRRRRLTFACSPRPCGRYRTWFGADGRVVIQRLCFSLPHVEKPFNSKVIKSFVPELRSRKVFRVSGFLCYVYVRYKHSMYISRIRIMDMLQNSFLILLSEKILRALNVRHLIRLTFLDLGAKASQLKYGPMNVGFLYIQVKKANERRLSNAFEKGIMLSFSSSIVKVKQ